MSARYHCQNPGRIQELRKRKTLNGIEYLEVDAATQLSLTLHFALALKTQLTADNFVIDGGVRVIGVRVTDVDPSGTNALKLSVSGRGDFSTYTLRLVAGADRQEPPTGYDPRLSEITFSFKVACPSEFDCRPKEPPPAAQLPEPQIDYLTKDYTGFRRLILDRLSVIMPDWRERNPADLQVVLVELLAYVGDHLSYFQDSVATEAYLGTARKRPSLRRHARLLDYVMHEGCNARAWVWLTVSSDIERMSKTDDYPVSRARTKFIPAGSGAVPEGVPLSELQPVFEPTRNMHGLYAAHNEVGFYNWSDSRCWLPQGATSATLRDYQAKRLRLVKGDVLVFEEVRGMESGKEADADPRRRHAVRLTKVIPPAKVTVIDGVVSRTAPRMATDPLTGDGVVEIEWAPEDALPFPLCLAAVVKNDQGEEELTEVSVARGNVILVDHGLTVENEPLVPAEVPATGAYRPRLRQPGLTFAGAVNEAKSAAAAMLADPREARPAVVVYGEGGGWLPQLDLLSSDRFAREFVVEMESDGTTQLRFGDGTLGRRPEKGSGFTATYRIGNGPAGNVGAGVITRFVSAHQAVTAARNPLPAAGGTVPEAPEQVRQFAPQAFRRQERAVTAADYAAIAERQAEVQKAAVRFRWTGSWHTAFVAIDRKGGREVDREFRKEVAAHLERYRLAGYDVEIGGAVHVPLDMALTACVKPGYFRDRVKEELLELLGNRDLPGGGRGFFHPDNFTFGQGVYLSAVYEAAMRVPGVASVEVTRFKRWGKAENRELEDALLVPGDFEIVRLDNDRNFPENGRLEVTVGGGL